ncbi:hypothetical protein jhhlp_006985 [Lomentospora prolificans]|uniref:Monooxygenase n=1 Tax=Lomentospora prolificans TaxID=41688 RepID=A0A2N3N1D6_9PEZI|nr:hypothetical protein jhhlp_006985 [Lomentospora prolificans]
MISKQKHTSSTYSQFACIGAGVSGIALGATLQRWYGITDIRIFERNHDVGGTWLVNEYPGCACDIPSALYSFSFEPKADWTRVLPTNEELWKYVKGVAEKYNLPAKTSFGTTVVKCEWLHQTNRWRLYLRRESGTTFIHECQFLFGGSGNLVEARKVDIPGADTFKGPIFHSSAWRKDVDLTNKDVVVFGNGCTGAQIVPAIVKSTKSLTHVVRSRHWIFPPIDGLNSDIANWMNKVIPGSMLLQRFLTFSEAEKSLRGFGMTKSATKFRKKKQAIAEEYMRSTAPEKYHDILIPDFEVGCKRRIFDSGYLKSLHEPNLLLTNEPVLEIVPDGIRMKDRVVKADVIVLANGFVTNNVLAGIEVYGRDGVEVREHWDSFGGSEAYQCTAMNGFPNFFLILGPNSATGHTSTLLAAENSINYALRVIKPILDGKYSVAEVKLEAEKAWVTQVHADLQKTVWFSGCKSWYVKDDEQTGKRWNAMSYPYSQGYYWYESLFPKWRDWSFMGPKSMSTIRRKPHLKKFLVLLAILAGLGWSKRAFLLSAYLGWRNS